MIPQWLKYYGVPGLLLLVVFAQLYLASNGLNRWRGGGFGMYSEFHYNSTDVIIKLTDTDSLAASNTALVDSLSGRLVKRVKVYPVEKQLNVLGKEVEKLLQHKRFLIEVWKPSLQMDSLSYQRKLLLRYWYENGKMER